jgi:predicted aconitase with swiveling domain
VIIRGRGAVAGTAEGEALVCPQGITGWGGIEPSTGVIKEYGNENRGESISGKILVLPGSKGSNGWSCYFNAARIAGHSPRAWIFTRIDSSAGVAATLLSIPTVVDFPADEDPCRLIQSGDWVKVDGDSGEIHVTRRRPWRTTVS